jgi:hypothetical protein
VAFLLGAFLLVAFLLGAFLLAPPELFLRFDAALLFVFLAAAFRFLVRAAFLAAALRFALDVAINFSVKHYVLCSSSHEFLLNYCLFLTKFSSPITFFYTKKGG